MRAVAGFAAAALLLLTGCAAQPQVPAGLTDEESARLVLASMAAEVASLQAQVPGAQPPSMVGEEYAENWDDWLALQQLCLESAGFDPVVVNRKGFFIGGDSDAVREARVHCAFRFPLDPRLRGALSTEQAGYAWDYWDSRLIPCVERLGYRVVGVPSRGQFIEMVVGRIGRLAWTPYQGMRIASQAEKDLIDEACPPLPVDPYNLYERTAIPLLILLPRT